MFTRRMEPRLENVLMALAISAGACATPIAAAQSDPLSVNFDPETETIAGSEPGSGSRAHLKGSSTAPKAEFTTQDVRAGVVPTITVPFDDSDIGLQRVEYTASPIQVTGSKPVDLPKRAGPPILITLRDKPPAAAPTHPAVQSMRENNSRAAVIDGATKAGLLVTGTKEMIPVMGGSVGGILASTAFKLWTALKSGADSDPQTQAQMQRIASSSTWATIAGNSLTLLGATPIGAVAGAVMAAATSWRDNGQKIQTLPTTPTATALSANNRVLIYRQPQPFQSDITGHVGNANSSPVMGPGNLAQSLGAQRGKLVHYVDHPESLDEPKLTRTSEPTANEKSLFATKLPLWRVVTVYANGWLGN